VCERNPLGEVRIEGRPAGARRGRLRNRPREEHGVALLESRPIVTAIVFVPRS
jgi:hypothetical protein